MVAEDGAKACRTERNLKGCYYKIGILFHQRAFPGSPVFA
jgi:hypothetical protein